MAPPLPSYRRPIERVLVNRLREPRRFMQVLSGPRQSGKTTLTLQALSDLKSDSVVATADEPLVRDSFWLEEQWVRGRETAGKNGQRGAILALDELQTIPQWSEVVKRLWDEDTRSGVPLRVVLLGSAPLLVQRGLSESLAGRFEVLRVPHWSFPEMREAFGWSLDQYLFFGGYPGAASLVEDHGRWREYVLESLIEPTLSRDILLLSRVDKPALLRQLFRLGCEYSGQVLAYNKMLGQLHDAGNTTTLAHYLDLLGGAGLLCGLSKYSGSHVRRRASSPKLLVLNSALMTATSGRTFEEARQETEFWGRLTESAFGAHLRNSSLGTPWRVEYWREGDLELDYVVSRHRQVIGVEIKTGRPRPAPSGPAAFVKTYPSAKIRMLSGDSESFERAFQQTVDELAGGANVEI